jgi:hypothetical protein
MRGEQLGHCMDRADPHFIRIAPGDRSPDMAAQRGQPAARDLRLLHDHRSRGPVRQLAGIARRNRTPFGQLLPAPEGRRKPREISQSGAGAVALVPAGPDSWQESSPLSRSVTFWITSLGAVSAPDSPSSCAAALRCVRQGIKGSGCVDVTCSWQSGTMRRKIGKASRRPVEPGLPYLPARRSRLALIPGNWSVWC